MFIFLVYNFDVHFVFLFYKSILSLYFSNTANTKARGWWQYWRLNIQQLFRRTWLAVCVAGDSGIGEESAHFIDENTDGRFYTEDEHIHVLLEFSHKYVVSDNLGLSRWRWWLWALAGYSWAGGPSVSLVRRVRPPTGVLHSPLWLLTPVSLLACVLDLGTRLTVII